MLFSETNFTIVMDLMGTLACAVSGIKMASGKNIDWFGAYIIGLVTAIGGGTVRDLLLDVQPFWMKDSKYLITTGIALIAAILFKEKLFKWGNTLFIFDTIGLSLFTIVGITKSIDAGLPVWTCVIMGAITGSVGGVIRDVLINEVPLLFRKEIYALASIAGGIVYFVCVHFEISAIVGSIVSALTVITVRIITVKYHWQLPILKTLEESESDGERNVD